MIWIHTKQVECELCAQISTNLPVQRTSRKTEMIDIGLGSHYSLNLIRLLQLFFSVGALNPTQDHGFAQNAYDFIEVF